MNKIKYLFLILFLSTILLLYYTPIYTNNYFFHEIFSKFINYYNNLLNVLSKENKRFIAGYKQEQYYDENYELKVKEYNVFNYYGGLSNPSIGFQYTFYTYTINDIYFNISIHTGYFTMFYFRNNLDNSISEGYFVISGGIKSSFITESLIINYMHD